MTTIYNNLIKHKGIGPYLAKRICAKFGIAPNTKWIEVQNSEVIQQFLANLKKITKPLKFFQPLDSNWNNWIKSNIKKQIELKTNKGYRFINHYPVRGQRTRSNAKTAKNLNSY